jgi:fumarylacetoacetate (FAA) hydrolase
MKLATYKDGSRDGQLLVVSRDLSRAHFASAAASRLQQLLDDWNFLSPQFEDLYQTLNQGKARHAFDFDARLCMAPLPRAFQFVAAQQPALGLSGPLLAQRSGDNLVGPHDDLRIADAARGLDAGAGLAVICGDVARGASAQAALEGVRLIMLCNEWHLPLPAPERIEPGRVAPQGYLATAFGPVAVTPDELGPAWSGGRIHLDLEVRHNARRFGLRNAAEGMPLHFGQLIAHVARLCPLRAGSIVGSGPIGLQEAIEAGDGATPQTAFMSIDDTLRIELSHRDGTGVFGAIEQRVTAAGDARA